MKEEAGPRERIVNKAVSLFYRQGVHVTGINQIIEEAGVAKASFYYHFKSKEDLVAETVNSFGALVKDKFTGIAYRSTTPGEFIAECVEAMKHDIRSNTFFGCPIANIAFEYGTGAGGIHKRLKSVMREVFLLLVDYFHDMRVKGYLDPDADVEMIARGMLQLYEGALTMWKMTGDRSYADDLEPMMKRLL
jgi:AcrR family transcriptional regulator